MYFSRYSMFEAVQHALFCFNLKEVDAKIFFDAMYEVLQKGAGVPTENMKRIMSKNRHHLQKIDDNIEEILDRRIRHGQSCTLIALTYDIPRTVLYNYLNRHYPAALRAKRTNVVQERKPSQRSPEIVERNNAIIEDVKNNCDATYREIGARHGVSHEWVRQLVKDKAPELFKPKQVLVACSNCKTPTNRSKLTTKHKLCALCRDSVGRIKQLEDRLLRNNTRFVTIYQHRVSRMPWKKLVASVDTGFNSKRPLVNQVATWCCKFKYDLHEYMALCDMSQHTNHSTLAETHSLMEAVHE